LQLGAFENKRSFCSIDNLLFVVQNIIEQNIEPGVYKVADAEALSTNELIKIMAASQNKNATIWYLPVHLIENIASFGGFLKLPLNTERLKKLTESYVVSNRKIKRALGIEKMPVTAVDGLRRTFEGFKGRVGKWEKERVRA
jgi:nucleoside-diphosphate-sugar epimerase